MACKAKILANFSEFCNLSTLFEQDRFNCCWDRLRVRVRKKSVTKNVFITIYCSNTKKVHAGEWPTQYIFIVLILSIKIEKHVQIILIKIQTTPGKGGEDIDQIKYLQKREK